MDQQVPNPLHLGLENVPLLEQVIVIEELYHLLHLYRRRLGRCCYTKMKKHLVTRRVDRFRSAVAVAVGGIGGPRSSRSYWKKKED